MTRASSNYSSWSGSYDSKTNLIYTIYYIVANGCGSNYVCHLEALDDRNAAMFDLDQEGSDLYYEKGIKQQDLAAAQADYAACVAIFGE